MILAETCDPVPGHASADRPAISNRDADSAPTDQAEEPAFLGIDDGKFDFDYEDLDFTGTMAALPESVSIASDDGMSHEDETPVQRIQPQVRIVQRMPPLPSGVSGMAAAFSSGPHRVPWPARAPAAAIPIMAFVMHNGKSLLQVTIRNITSGARRSRGFR